MMMNVIKSFLIGILCVLFVINSPLYGSDVLEIKFTQILSGEGLYDSVPNGGVVYLTDPKSLVDVCVSPPASKQVLRYSRSRKKEIVQESAGYDNISLPIHTDGETKYIFVLLDGNWRGGAKVLVQKITIENNVLVVRATEHMDEMSGGSSDRPWVFLLIEEQAMKANEAVYITLVEETYEAGRTSTKSIYRGLPDKNPIEKTGDENA